MSRSDQPGTSFESSPVVSAACEAGLSLQIPEASLDRVLVRGHENLLDRGWCEGVEQADTLRCGERQIPAGQLASRRTRQRLTGLRMAAVQHGGQLLPGHGAKQIELAVGVTDPAAFGLTTTEVVVLHPGRDRTQVVLLLTGRQLADAQHPNDSAQRPCPTPCLGLLRADAECAVHLGA